MSLVTNYYQSLIDVALFLFFVIGAKVIILFTIHSEKPTVLHSRYLLWLGYGGWWLLSAVLQIFPWSVTIHTHQLIQEMYPEQPSWVIQLFRPVAVTWTTQPVTWNILLVVFQFIVGIMLLTERENIAGWISLLLATLFSFTTWATTEAFGGLFSPRLSIVPGSPGPGLLAAIVGALLLVPNDYWERNHVVFYIRHAMAILYGLAAVAQLRPRFWTSHITIIFGRSPYSPMAHFVDGFISIAQNNPVVINILLIMFLSILAIITWKNWSYWSILVISSLLLLWCWIFGQDLGLLPAMGANLYSAPLWFLLTWISVGDTSRKTKGKRL
ncbi:hypothetical protein [Sulfobacillus thermosulfidooxidans]|uniref:hypothetical protein n=1 Tax=Sulfobacillus thermosulfidooxidans TaxID=28034 RepID=UPI0006B5DC12|nr:hypothetical protein [Sulfobacillus thermosulfidooxidans]